MKRFIVAVLGSIMFAAVAPAVFDMILRLQGGHGITPDVVITMLPIGIWAFDYDYRKRMKKRKEEEERQAEQERTNELMREYLEKKLREEENK